MVLINWPELLFGPQPFYSQRGKKSRQGQKYQVVLHDGHYTIEHSAFSPYFWVIVVEFTALLALLADTKLAGLTLIKLPTPAGGNGLSFRD